MNNIRFLLFLILLTLGNSCVAQKPGNSSTQYDEEKFFFEHLKLLHQLNFDSKTFSKKAIKKFGLQKKYKFSYDDSTTLISYSFGISQNRIAGGYFVILKSGQPFLSSGRFGIQKPAGASCDSSFRNELIQNGVDLSQFDKDCCAPCFYTFDALDNNEKIKLTALLPDSLKQLAVVEYISVAPLKELLDPRFDFYDDRVIQRQFGIPGPRLTILKKLYEARNYKAITDLLFTKNKIFNWFVAEGLHFLDLQSHFLDNDKLKEIGQFNGTNGFPSFRKEATLKELYL